MTILTEPPQVFNIEEEKKGDDSNNVESGGQIDVVRFFDEEES